MGILEKVLIFLVAIIAMGMSTSIVVWCFIDLFKKKDKENK